VSKDPAFLFYTQDFLTGTTLMTDEQVGKYIRLLCLQHQTGHLEERHMLNICKTYDKDIFSKFIRDSEGRYFHERLEKEIVRRVSYCESRRKNKLAEKTYDKHMETETILKDKKIVKRKRKSFIPPTLEEVISYFEKNGYKQEVARRAWMGYNEANWHDTKGDPVLNWKQKMINVWFKPENIIDQVTQKKPVRPLDDGDLKPNPDFKHPLYG
jgi:uncharacterized protein YdaU (DUF1376 family)